MEPENTPRVREATADDARAVHALAHELAAAIGDTPPEFGPVEERLRQLLDEPSARVIVAEGGDGAVVGAASYWLKPDLAHGDVAVEVPMLVVSEEARREGVGKALMEEVRKAAAGVEAGVIELIATSSNVVAREFYRSLGFVETDHVALEFVGDVQNPPDPDEVAETPV